MTLKIKYDDFVEKFKTKKTTDDCYTPENIYNAIVDWGIKEYGIDRSKIIRPFYPGGDYENLDQYEADSVVLDNPPFSILAQIVRFYTQYEIKFFLFAPALTFFSSTAYKYCCMLCSSVSITYENGAVVRTSFVTNLEDKELAFRTTPDLSRILSELDKRNKNIKKLPKYHYPPEVVTAARLGALSLNGIDFKAKRSEVSKTVALDAQRTAKKTIYGDGFLISENKAAELKAAELKINEEIFYWQISERERKIIDSLGA